MTSENSQGARYGPHLTWIKPEPNARGSAPDYFSSRLTQLEIALAWLAVFTSPMNFLRHPAAYFTFSDAVVLLCLLVMLVRRSVPLRPLGPFSAMWMGGAVLLLAGLLASSLFVGDALRGIVITAQYLFSLIVLPIIIVRRPIEETISLSKAFVWSIVLMCLFGVYLIEIDGTTNTRFVSGSGRMMSFVERENECASLIALTIPLAIWLRTIGKISFITAMFAICLMIYGVLLTGSNTGLGAVVLGYLLYVLANFSIWYAAFGTASLGGAYYVMVFWGKSFLPEIFQKRVLPALTSGDVELAGTLSDRMLLFHESIDMANNTGLLGIGADQYRIHSFYDQVVHNTYTLIWAEGGILAFVGLTMTIAAGICTAASQFKLPYKKPAALCAVSCLLVFALAINAVPHIYARFWYVPIYLALAALLGTLDPNSDRRPATELVGRRL